MKIQATHWFPFFFFSSARLPPSCIALSTPPSEAALLARGRLHESLSSISKKVTLSPEVIIPEPTDPTALLLQANEVTKLSNKMRTSAKANAAFLSGSVNSIRTFCTEQATATGNFPAPLPVVFCESSYSGEDRVAIADIADAGASGVLYCVLDGKEISSVEDVKDSNLANSFQSALDNGIQLIPEIVLSKESSFDENDVSELFNTLVEQCGVEPVAVVISIGSFQSGDDNEGDGEVQLPKVPKALKKKNILGSVRAVAGGGRIRFSVNSFTESGFTGLILRSECLPGFRMNPDLEFVGGFWSALIGDLKSTKSKTFNFRSKVALDRDVPMEWYNYQKDVMESGALGLDDPGANPVDAATGDYVGF